MFNIGAQPNKTRSCYFLVQQDQFLTKRNLLGQKVTLVSNGYYLQFPHYSLLPWTYMRLSEKMGTKYPHIFDTFKHFWVAHKPNFFDPSMALGGAAISFFLTWNFGLKFILGHNFVKKISCTHFWNHVLSKKLDKMAKKWNSKLCWSLVKTLFFLLKTWKKLIF